MRYVTLINRTSRTLEGKWDGKIHKIEPGKNSFPETLAYKFRDQHPLMGSQDPYTLELIYLCGIEEEGDPITPLEQSDAIELLDRSRYRNAIPVMVVQGNGLFSNATASKPFETAPGAPVDTTFVKP